MMLLSYIGATELIKLFHLVLAYSVILYTEQLPSKIVIWSDKPDMI
jgi:hypothetical protein